MLNALGKHTKPLPKVIRRKLPAEYYGEYDSSGKIEIDSRLKGKDELIIFIHEGLHWADFDLTEEQVRRISRNLAALMRREYDISQKKI